MERESTEEREWRAVDECANNALLDRDLSLRLQQALTAEKDDLLDVMSDPSADVLQAALRNPKLEEDHLVALLKRRNLGEELFRRISRSGVFSESHAAKVAMAHNPDAPCNILHAILQELHLFELVSLCYLPTASADLRVSAERAIIQRLPGTSLGNKLTLARRATDPVLDALLKEGHPQVVDLCLGNPRLKETAIFQILNSAAASPEIISAIARHHRWKDRMKVKLAILRHRNTPLIWYTLFLPGLSTPEVKQLLASRMLNQRQTKAAEDELRRRR